MAPKQSTASILIRAATAALDETITVTPAEGEEFTRALERQLQRLDELKEAATNNVTPIRPDIAPVLAGESTEAAAGETLEKLNERTGYSGSIQGGTLDEALDEQRQVLWDAQAIIASVAQALEQQFKAGPRGVPVYSRALQRAAQLIDDATGALEAGVIEDRALAISRERDPET